MFGLFRDDAKRVGFGRGRRSEQSEDEAESTDGPTPSEGSSSGEGNVTRDEIMAQMAERGAPKWAMRLARNMPERMGKSRRPGSASGEISISRRHSAKTVPLIMPIMFGAFGTLALAIGLYFLADAARFMEVARPTTGEVVSMEVMRDEDGTTYRPVIRYRGGDGDLYDGQTHISSSEYNFPIGSEVEILVEDGVRDTVRIDGWFSIWGVPLVFTIFGIVFEGVAVFLFMLRARHRRRA